MDIIAKGQSVRISPRKVRLVADSIKDMSVEKAVNTLSMTHRRGASVLYDILKSAIANALNNSKKSMDTLKIKTIDILDGPGLKRFHPSTRGRVHPYKKRSSNITITLEAKE